MRIVVTGGGGFLGSHLVERLRQRGEDPFVPRRAEYDLTRWDDAERLFRDARPELVFHLAAEVGGIGANRANPGRYWYANLMMGAHVLELSRLSGVQKVVTAGTVCAYPKFSPVPFSEDDLWDGYPEETNAPYGVAKKSVLVGGQSYRQQYGTTRSSCCPRTCVPPARQLRPRDLARHSRADPQDGPVPRPGRAVGGRLSDARVPLRGGLRRRTSARRRPLRRRRFGESRHERGDHRRSRRTHRGAHRLRRRDRLGYVDAERPAAAPARRVTRGAAVRVRRAHVAARGARAHDRSGPLVTVPAPA